MNDDWTEWDEHDDADQTDELFDLIDLREANLSRKLTATEKDELIAGFVRSLRA